MPHTGTVNIDTYLFILPVFKLKSFLWSRGVSPAAVECHVGVV